MSLTNCCRKLDHYNIDKLNSKQRIELSASADVKSSNKRGRMTLSSNDENMTKLSITQLLLQPRDLITNKKIIDLAALVDNFKCWYKFCLVLISGYINVTYI